MKILALFSVFALGLTNPCEGFGVLSKKNIQAVVNSEASREINNVEGRKITKVVTGSILALGLAVSSAAPTLAVSGGGLDFAGIDISGQDFSNNSKAYKGKDFTQVLAKATNFANSNLQGCRFYKAYLVNTDFSNADIRGVSLFSSSSQMIKW